MLRGNGMKVRLVMGMLAAVIAIGPSASVLAAPQWGPWGGRNDRYRRFDKNEVRQIGRQNGYQMGLREGRYDAQRRGRMDYKDSRAYRDGMIGYRSEYGHQGDYRRGFRDGFEDGYRAAYRNGGYNNGRWNDGWGRNDDWDRGRNDDWYRGRRRY